MTAYEDLFELPAGQVDFELLQQFVAMAEAANALVESKVVELKVKRNGTNVVDSVAAFANTDGGLILVGVDEKKRGAERFVGLSVADHDALTAQLHTLIPDAMPEVIPIAIPGSDDQIVVLLRVNAEIVPHPVVVSGKVVVRIPGHTIPADRNAILGLVQRDSAVPGNAQSYAHAPFSPANCELWTGKPMPLLELRTWGTVRLPASVLDHSWFGTQAKEVATSILGNSPLPDSLWSAAPEPFRRHEWLMTDARAAWFRLESEARPDLVQSRPIRTGAQAHLAGQDLSVLIAVGLIAEDPNCLELQPRLSMQFLHEALVTTLFVHATLCRTLANELDVPEPMSWFPVCTQMMVGTGGKYGFLDDVLDLNRWSRDTSNRQPSHLFPRAPSPRGDSEAINRLSHEWLNLLLLDVGARHFEGELARMEMPTFLRSDL